MVFLAYRISFNVSFVAYYILSNSLESLHTDKTLINENLMKQSQDHPQAGKNETKNLADIPFKNYSNEMSRADCSFYLLFQVRPFYLPLV